MKEMVALLNIFVETVKLFFKDSVMNRKCTDSIFLKQIFL